MQVSVKVVDAEIAGLVSVPDVERDPVQPPDAAQADALVLDHVSDVVPPVVTDCEADERVTVGAGGVGTTAIP